MIEFSLYDLYEKAGFEFFTFDFLENEVEGRFGNKINEVYFTDDMYYKRAGMNRRDTIHGLFLGLFEFNYKLVESDIVLNRQFFENPPSYLNKDNLRLIIIHELLHAFNLDHIDDYENIMHSNAQFQDFKIGWNVIQFIQCLFNKKIKENP